jgi:aryl-alcohol dehydrogenase-like predicted oxidoreductase
MRLCLGTVQFGLPYGVANASGQVTAAEVQAILRLARDSRIDTLDTAIAYGDSERALGEAGVDDFRVVTKLPLLTPDAAQDVDGWVRTHLRDSLGRLRARAVHGLLLHRAGDLSGPQAAPLFAALRAVKAEGLVERIGVSIYGPEDLAPIVERYRIDLVQAPFNIVDRRLERSGWLARLADAGIGVHARSAFLQGLLLMTERPAYFARWSALWSRWQEWLAQSGASATAACLQFALRHAAIEKVVVGVDNAAQLRELVSAAQTLQPTPPDDLSSDDADLVNPSRWKAA